MRRESLLASLLQSDRPRRRSRPSESLREFGTGGYPSTSVALEIRPRNYNDPNGYYAILGVAPWASMADIKAAFHRLAKENHPDLGGDKGLFQLINQVYQTLSNPLLRREYDDTPKDCIYLGDIEVQELRRKFSDLGSLVVDQEATAKYAQYSFMATHDIRRVADKWYEIILPIYRLYGVCGTVILTLKKISEPSARNEGLLEVLVLPEWLEPDFFTAFYIISTQLEKRYGEPK